MRSPWLARSLLLSLSLSLLATACDSSSDDGGAAHVGIIAEAETMPEVMIDDELGTDVRVFVSFEHYGGPDTETLEVVSANLALDLEPFADLELAIPADHPPFPGLADGEAFDFELRGSVPANHEDWGLCADPEAEALDGQRVSVNLVLRVTPGANSDENEFVFESLAVTLHCTHTN